MLGLRYILHQQNKKHILHFTSNNVGFPALVELFLHIRFPKEPRRLADKPTLISNYFDNSLIFYWEALINQTCKHWKLYEFGVVLTLFDSKVSDENTKYKYEFPGFCIILSLKYNPC